LGPDRRLQPTIADWIAQGNAGDSYNQGSLSLSYDAPDANYLGSQLSVVNAALSVSFDVPSENAASFGSSRLEGLWWQPDSDSQYDLVLSSTTGSSVEVLATFTGEQDSTGSSPPLSLALEPHQTEVLKLKDMKLPFSNGEGAGKEGGISITHSGQPGAVLAYGMVAKSEVGFSSHFVFSDPAARRSQTLAAAHLLTGKPDVPGFSDETRFTSIALLRNASDEPIEVTPKVSFKSNGAAKTATLSVHHLAPQQAEAMDIAAELKRAGIRGAVTGCGLTLGSSGQPGALVAHLTSFDQTRSHAFDVPMKDPGIAANRLSGSYPWNIDDDYQSVIHVRNITDEKARFTIQLDFEGGSYTLPLQVLDPQQEVAVDIRQLRDAQVKDSIGRVIPMEVTHGQATWSERGRQALIGRVEVFSVSRSTSNSFSCGGPCCPADTESIYVTPDAFSGVGGGGWRRSCVRVAATRLRRGAVRTV
jgi:hypothetical protein